MLFSSVIQNCIYTLSHTKVAYRLFRVCQDRPSPFPLRLVLQIDLEISPMVVFFGFFFKQVANRFNVFSDGSFAGYIQFFQFEFWITNDVIPTTVQWDIWEPLENCINNSLFVVSGEVGINYFPNSGKHLVTRRKKASWVSSIFRSWTR